MRVVLSHEKSEDTTASLSRAARSSSMVLSCLVRVRARVGAGVRVRG